MGYQKFSCDFSNLPISSLYLRLSTPRCFPLITSMVGKGQDYIEKEHPIPHPPPSILWNLATQFLELLTEWWNRECPGRKEGWYWHHHSSCGHCSVLVEGVAWVCWVKPLKSILTSALLISGHLCAFGASPLKFGFSAREVAASQV